MDLGSAFKFITKHAPADPVTASVLRSFYELSRFSSQIKAVDEQTRDLLSTTYHVAFNVKEARRLRRDKAALLDANERHWMDSVIRDTEFALFEIAKLVEPARIDLSVRKSVEFHNKVNWVFKQNIKVGDKHAWLTTCHQSLVAVISSLNLKLVKLEIETIPEEHPSPHDAQMQRFLNFQNQRNRRRSVMSLRSANSSAESSSSVSWSSIMTKATSHRNSDSITTGSVASPGMVSLPAFEALNLECLTGDDKVFTDFHPPFTSSIDRSPSVLPPVVSSVDNESDPSDVKDESGIGSPTDYFTIPQHSETTTYASVSSTKAADTEHDAINIRDDGDKELSATNSLLPPSFPGADGLQVYDPYSPYHSPLFPPLHTRASTSSFVDARSMTNADSQDIRSSPNFTQENVNSSMGLNHYPHTQESQQQMRRAFSDSRYAPELHRPISEASLAVSEGAQPSLNARRGGVCRAKRSWLTLHASRVSDGHGSGWSG